MGSDFLNNHEEDKDIKFFREEYPDIYDFIVRLTDGNVMIKQSKIL